MQASEWEVQFPWESINFAIKREYQSHKKNLEIPSDLSSCFRLLNYSGFEIRTFLQFLSVTDISKDKGKQVIVAKTL